MLINESLIVLINYNSTQFTQDCIDSIRKIENSDYSIFIFDNNSSAAEVEKLSLFLNLPDFRKDTLVTAAHFSIRIFSYFSSTNSGFAIGNNRALNLVSNVGFDFKYYLFLNNDTLLTQPILEKFISQDASEVNKAFLTCKIMTPDQMIWYNGGSISRIECIGKHSYSVSEFPKIEDVGFMTGCCLFFNHELLSKFGNKIFDESYFMYTEDVDFSATAHLKNIKLKILRDISIIHRVYGSSKQSMNSSLPFYYMNRNRFLFAKKFLKKSEIPFFFIFMILRSFYLIIVKRNSMLLAGSIDGLKLFFNKD
jgi:GT2 family glycosyltransferase